MNSIEQLAQIIKSRGPIQTCRISSAQAKGAAKAYSYWDAVRYEIRLRKRDNTPINVATERAVSATRSHNKASQMLRDLINSENRIQLQKIGPITEESAARIVDLIRGEL